MFIPLGDDNSDRKIRPIVNYAFIGINLFVFFFLQGMGPLLPPGGGGARGGSRGGHADVVPPPPGA